VKLLLDTHAVIWAVEGDARLGSKARKRLEETPLDSIAISDISLLEIALLASKNKISFRTSTKSFLLGLSQYCTVLPIDPSIASEAATLKLPQGDPFDRVIVATARRHKLTLVSRDKQITASKLTKVVW